MDPGQLRSSGSRRSARLAGDLQETKIDNRKMQPNENAIYRRVDPSAMSLLIAIPIPIP